MKALVMIPAYNEGENIVRVVEELTRNHPQYDYVVMNDHSADNTLRLCREKGFNILDLPCNLGIGGCVQTGYLYALDRGYDIAIQMDGDGQHDPAFLDALTAPLRAGEADIAIGSRFLEKEGFQSSGMRRLGIRFLSWLIKTMTGVRILDVTSGLRAVNREYIALYARDYADDYPEPEAIVAAAERGARIREVPVTMREREHGTSSISPLKSVYYMIKVSLAIVLYRVINGRRRRT